MQSLGLKYERKFAAAGEGSLHFSRKYREPVDVAGYASLFEFNYYDDGDGAVSPLAFTVDTMEYRLFSPADSPGRLLFASATDTAIFSPGPMLDGLTDRFGFESESGIGEPSLLRMEGASPRYEFRLELNNARFERNGAGYRLESADGYLLVRGR
jgi:hypothetical protein